MRIGPLHVGRAQAAADPTPSPHKAAGASGTVNISGYLQPDDERNPELLWPESLRTFQRMQRTDGAVREAVLHTTAPVLNASWEIEAAGDDQQPSTPEDLEVAEMVRRAYFEWALTPFRQVMQLTLRYPFQGFQLFELTEQIIDAELTYTPSDSDNPVTVPSRQFVTWRRWEHRRPETVYKFNAPAGELESVTQLAFKDGNWGQWEMDAQDLALFVNEQEGDDFTGLSMLRAAYKSWKLKELTERVMAMAVERHGLGINTAYLPTDARTDTALVDRVEEMLSTLKAGESNYLIFPGPKGTASGTTGDSTGYFFEINTPPGGLPDMVPWLNYLRGDIKGAVLARFSELGHGSVGARATSNTQAEVWYAALHALADQVCAVHGEKIRQLVDKNYSGVTRYPKLVARDIETKSLEEFADANSKLVASGAVEPDRSYRAFVRSGLDAPQEDDPEAIDAAKQALTEPLGPSPPVPSPTDAGGS